MTTYAAVTRTSGATAATWAGVSTAAEAVPAPNQVEVLMVGTPMARASSSAARARFHMIALRRWRAACGVRVDGVYGKRKDPCRRILGLPRARSMSCLCEMESFAWAVDLPFGCVLLPF